MTMKMPKYLLLSVHEAIDAGINGFAAQLLAESYADTPEKFQDETTIFVAKARNGTPVYMLISTQPPDWKQFKDWPKGDSQATFKPKLCKNCGGSVGWGSCPDCQSEAKP